MATPATLLSARARSVLIPVFASLCLALAEPARAQETCVLTKGYWRSHAEAWRVTSLVLGSPSNPRHTYTKSELLSLLDQNGNRDASLILASQLIAAKLNVATGSNPAPVAEALARADMLLGTFAGRLPYRVAPNTPMGADMTVTATTLERYNVGAIPGSCGTANRAPLANAGPDRTARLQEVVTLDGSGSSDPDGDAIAFAWRIVSAPAGSIAALSNSAIVNPTFAPDLRGDYVVALVVFDGALESTPDTVTVSTVNSPPVANAGHGQTPTVGATVTLDGSGSTDVDGDALTYRWSVSARPEGSAAELLDPTSVTPSITIDRSGSYEIQLIVNDGTVDSAAATVTISTVNSRPQANAGSDQSAFVDAQIQLDGGGSTDVDGNLLTYRWSLTHSPSGSAATLSDPSAVRPTFIVDRPGDYVAQLIVNDGALDSAADTVTVSTLNRPPLANAGLDATVTPGAIVPLDGTQSTDPDGDRLTYRWALTTRPTGSPAALSDPESPTPTFVADVFGTYVAQLIVNDGLSDSTPDTVTISMENSVPVASAGPDQGVSTGAVVQLDGSGSSDADGPPLQFSWSIIARPTNSAATLSDVSAVAPTFVADLAGSYVAQLIVSDGIAQGSPDTVTITVQDGAETRADLSLSLVVSQIDPPVGSSMFIRIDLVNSGPDETEDVRVRLALPAGYAIQEANTGAGTYDQASGVWIVGSMTWGRIVQLGIRAVINQSGPYELAAAIINSSASDPEPANNSAVVAMAPNANADLRVSYVVAPSGTQTVGTNLTWLLDLNNDGPASVTDVTVQQLVPAGYTITNAVVHFGGPYDAATGIWHVGSLGTSGLARLVLSARVNASGPTTLVASVTGSSQPDPNPANNTAVAPAINRPPVADAGVDQIASTHATVTLVGTQSNDADGDALTFQWTFDLRPLNSAAVLVAVNPSAPTFVPDQGGTYVVRLTVIDPSGASSSDTVSISAEVHNRAPVIRSTPNTAATVGQPYRYALQTADPDAGDVLVFALLTAPAGMSIDAAGVMTWTPASDQGGSQPVTVSVTDAGGLVVTQSFSIQVSSPSNRAPLAADDSYEVRVNESLGVGSPGVVQNDTDESALSARLVAPPANGTLLFNADGSFVYTPHTQQPGEFVMAENVNLAARLPGVRVNVGSFTFNGGPCGRPECGVDENVATSWSAGVQTPVFFEVEFLQDVIATELQIVGHRSGFLQNFKITAGVFQVFAADGSELYNSGNVELVSPARDARVVLNRLVGVRRVRFTATEGDGGTVLSRGFAEFKVIGSALMRRELVREPNVARLLPAAVRASSFSEPNLPEAIIDESPANWFAATGNAGEFIEIVLPRDATVTRLESANPSGLPGGGATSNPINCNGQFTMLNVTDQVVFDSGLVNTPTGNLHADITFSLNTGVVSGVRRIRYTAAGCTGFSIGFSEIRVFGTVDLETPALSLVRKIHALAGREVHSTPIVVNLTDDNGDGAVDANDTPDIIAPVEAGENQVAGVIIAISGDDGHVLFTAGQPDLVSPWSELAAADLDGDGLPEIVAVHSDGNHLIAFDHTGALKWVSDPNASPFFNLVSATGNVFTLKTGAIAIANLDGIGGPEIVLGASVFDANGRLLGDGRALGGSFASNVRSSIPAVADIDLDGTPELVAGPTAYRLVGGALSKVWQRPDRGDGYVAIANLDDDPQAESVIVSNGTVYALNDDGSDVETWNAPSHAPVALPGGGQGGAPLIVDVDGDGQPEIGVAGATQYALFNHDGSIRWQTIVRDRSSHSTGSIAFDLDGDGQVEIIYRDELFLRIYRGSDGVLLAKAGIGSSTWAELPVVADVDNDGHADLVVSSDSVALQAVESDTGIIVLQDVANRWMRTRRIWNQHSYHVTNVGEDASIPLIETPHWLLPGVNSFRTNAFVPGESADRADSFTYTASDGVLQSNVATVRIAIRTPNSPPRITSSPVTSGAGGVRYTYAAIASDPDAGDILTFSLPTAPTGMSIEPNAGLIQWVPTASQRGSHEVVVKVQDLRGLFALQGYTVTVGEAVVVPDVVGQPRATAEASVTSAALSVGVVSTRHSPTVPEGRVITQSPVGETLAAPGAAVNLVVSVGPAPTGTVPEVVAMTRAGAEADITAAGFVVGTVTVRSDAIVPANTVLAQSPTAGSTADVGSAIALVVSLGPPPSTIDFDHDGFTGDQGDCNDSDPSIHPGAIDAPGDGIDQNCNGVDSVVGDDTPPIAVLESPSENAEIPMPRDIVGTVSDANFLHYTLSLAPVDSTAFVTLATGMTAVASGVLGRIDPTLLENGLYLVRLIAEDVNGQITVDERVYRVIGAAKLGVFTLSFVDLQVPVSGIPITVMRNYDSRVKDARDFGVGWSLQIKTGFYRHNRPPGAGWQIKGAGGPFGLPCSVVNEMRTHLTEVRLSDRESYVFRPTLTDIATVAGGCIATVAFEFVRGSAANADLQVLGNTQVIYTSGDSLTEFDGSDDTGLLFNPPRVRLTTIDGRVVDFDRARGITRLEDSNANQLTITDAGIAHSSGKSISFVRDEAGRIAHIVDPQGRRLEYGYDTRGDLVSFTDQTAVAMRFTYDDAHNLLEVFDPLNRSIGRQEYDAEGRLVAVVDASGRRIEMTHNIDDRTEVVRDRLGNPTVLVYDEAGNILQRTDAIGREATFSYDARGNKLTETDALGHTTTYAYDANDKVVLKRDPLGRETTSTYNGRGQLLTTTNPLAETTARSYDARGNLLTDTDAAGNTTFYTYDAAGRRATARDPLGNVTRYDYTSAGDRRSETNALGHQKTWAYDGNGNRVAESVLLADASGPSVLTTTLTYDAKNRRVATTDPTGGVERTEYDTQNRIVATIDKLGGRTEFTYSDTGLLVGKTDPDGVEERFGYDEKDRRTIAIDRAGRTTTTAYDAVDRPTQITHPDGTSIQSIYDDADRLIETIDERGHRTRSTFDAAGQLLTRTDALGNVTTYRSDAAGRRTETVDARGNATTVVYDAVGRETVTQYSDATSRVIAYDARGRKISETDQAGQTTRFEYDAIGRLTAVVDALGGRTTYAYDERGNRIRETDALSRTTIFEYDALGRQIRLRRPLGMSQSFTYDSVGNLTSLVDFDGQTTHYTYDSLKRRIETELPDGGVERVSYSLTGKRATVTDARGVTRYSYDGRDRLLTRDDPDGTTLAYTYDAAGNRLGVASSVATTAYEYDELNRLIRVRDADNRVTSYGYDAVGNRVAMARPNGATTSYTYDSQNRLTLVRDAAPDGTTLSSFAYTLGAAGNRLRVVEASSRTVDYTYDSLYRLSGERIVDPAGGNQTIAYTYDAVGNRLSKSSDVTGVFLYTYDGNNRLLTEGSTSYLYDLNGNLLTKSVSGATTGYGYDSRRRLMTVTDAGQTTRYVYDVDGNRVRAIVNESAETSFLVDTNRRFAEVLAETDGSGTPVVVYTHGDDLISQTRGGDQRFYHYDGQMSTRLLSDESATATDRYDYDAFGVLLRRSGSTPNQHLYTGEFLDPQTGYYYLRARWLAAAQGRFTTEDPVSGLVFDPQTLHKYVYALNHPVNRIDPSGQFSLLSVASVQATFSALSSIALTHFTFAIVSVKIIDALYEPGVHLRYGALRLLGQAPNEDLKRDALKLYEHGNNMIAVGTNLIKATQDILALSQSIAGMSGSLHALTTAPSIPNYARVLAEVYALDGKLVDLQLSMSDLASALGTDPNQVNIPQLKLNSSNMSIAVSDVFKTVLSILDLLGHL